MSDLKHLIASLERKRPDPETDPAEFKRINDEISKLIDRNRIFSAPVKRAVV